jgi:nicotinate-nucleotide adenylyltransferase
MPINPLMFGRQKPFKVGVYLGSFNPIHNGHLRLARQARDQENLDAVELVALSRPVHKKTDFMSDDDRHYLNTLAVQGQAKLHASDVDIQAKGPYLADFLLQYPEGQAKVKFILKRTLNMLDAIRRKYEAQTNRPVELHYIVGADGLASYPQAWKEPEYGEFLKKARLLVAPRPGAPSIHKTVQAIRAIHQHVKYKVLRVLESPLSSTAIRERLEKGIPVSIRMVPKAVADVLNRRGKSLLTPDAA